MIDTINKAICFDMDGTIADLYNVREWLKKLEAEDASPYLDALPMCDMESLALVMNELRNQGWKIGVITWLAKDSSREYDKLVRVAKRYWLECNGFACDFMHMVKYGTDKASTLRSKYDYAVLIDDNDEVRNKWKLGNTINPITTDIIAQLTAILNHERGE